MGKKRIMVIFGTRPEAIKMVPVIKVLEKAAEFELIVVVTGQHRQMLDQVLETFDVSSASVGATATTAPTAQKGTTTAATAPTAAVAVKAK